MTRTLLFMAVLTTTACASRIQHGLDERGANELVSVLTTNGFDARKVSEKGKSPSWAIEVDDDRATEALRLLAELKLPRAPKLTTAKLAGESSLIETPSIERLRQLEGQEGDLEQSLETLDGVTSASVELVVPPAPRPGAAATPSKASVLLRVGVASAERLEQQRAELRALVAASVDGLTADDVVLVIDGVQGHATTTLAPVEPVLRRIIAGLGLTLTVLALGLVAMARQLRSHRRALTVSSARPMTPPLKPVIASAVQRATALKETVA